MITKKQFTFIIGAGSNCTYNFPTGFKLSENICNNFPSYLEDYKQHFGYSNGFDLDGYSTYANDFVNALKGVVDISVDKFVNINPPYKSAGIHSIFCEILHSENKAALPKLGLKKDYDWYSYLFTKMTEGINSSEDILNFGQNKISFISFNYDRSLEHFLYTNLFNLAIKSGLTVNQIYDSFKNIQFIHVYGKLGSLPFENGIHLNNPDYDQCSLDLNTVPFGKSDHAFAIAKRLESNIDLMYSSRKDSKEILSAKTLISQSERVLFLGFGFDSNNLNILELPKLLIAKQVFATAFRKTANEIKHIKSILNMDFCLQPSDVLDCDCLTLLRERLI